MLGKSPINLCSLRLGQGRHILGHSGDAIPQIFRELNTLGRTESEQLRQKGLVHVVNQSQ